MAWVRVVVVGLCLFGVSGACLRAPSTEQGAGEARSGLEGKGPRTPVPTKRPRSHSTKTGCVADNLVALSAYERQPPDCVADAAGSQCARACARGDMEACYERGNALQDDPDTRDEGDRMYRKSCEFGLAIGCTNYAAGLWVQDDAAALDCARRTFEKTCAADETWGCGMLGRMLIDGEAAEKPDVARGRTVLERACDSLGGFSCRVLAMELERGRLGSHKRSRIRKLLARACDTGDDDGCGNPKTAASTFRPAADKE